MRRATLSILAIAALFSCVDIAEAKHAWWNIVHPIKRDTCRNNCWPAPFVRIDAEAVRAPLAIMVRNGWRRQNVMGSHHFDSQSGDLTLAGKAKVRAIIIESPAQHRTIFVQRSLRAETTMSRIDAVQRAATAILPEGELPAVEPTDLSPPGWPASQIDLINTNREKTAPAPQLPQGTATGG